MQLEIAQPEQMKTAKAMLHPTVFTTIAGDGRKLWLVAVRKSMGGQNEDKLYQLARPKGVSRNKMLQACEAVAEDLATGGDKSPVVDADLFKFEKD